MRYAFLVLCLLLLASTALAQSTTVSATITDAGGQTWNNGTYSFTFQPAASNPTAQYFWNGAPFSSSQTFSGNLSGSGAFSTSIPSSTSITPSGSAWVTQVCPAASSPCYQIALTITGTTQSISGQVIPPAVQVSLAGPPNGATAYTDSEIVGAKTGSFYFNLNDSSIHTCTGFPPCTWAAVSSASSILASNNVFTGVNTFTQPIVGSITGNAATATTAVTATNLGGPGTVSGNYSHSGVETFLGQVNEKNLFGTSLFVDCSNTQGWSGGDFGAWINNAISTLPSIGGFKAGTINLAPCGAVTQSTGVTITSPYLSVLGPGSGAMQISCTVTTDCWNIRTNVFGINIAGKFGGFTLIGQGSGNANAVGVHTGDMVGAEFYDLQIDNFLGANSSCFWMDNQSGWFERNKIDRLETGIHQATQSGCTKNIRATVNGGTNSFGRTKFTNSYMSVGAATTGLSLEGTTFWYEGVLEIGGNMVGNGGTAVSLSGSANLFNDRIDIGIECSNTCSAATLLSATGTSTMSWDSGRIVGGAGFTNSISTTMPIHMNYGSFDQSPGDRVDAVSLSLYNNEGSTFGVSVLSPLGTPSFLGGFFENLIFNGTSFVSATDLTNNGGAYVAGAHNGQMYFAVVPTSSPSTGQTITQANITNFIQATLTPSYLTLKPPLDLIGQGAPTCVVGHGNVWEDSTYNGLKGCTNGSNIHKLALTDSGSCAMAAGTTCTFSIGAAFNSTPLTFPSIDGASTVPATANSAKCSISGTTVTITAGISNSLTWDCVLVGNPN
jgi:hypothetical protein